jgi:hypothetical protein
MIAGAVQAVCRSGATPVGTNGADWTDPKAEWVGYE